MFSLYHLQFDVMSEMVDNLSDGGCSDIKVMVDDEDSLFVVFVFPAVQEEPLARYAGIWFNKKEKLFDYYTYEIGPKDNFVLGHACPHMHMYLDDSEDGSIEAFCEIVLRHKERLKIHSDMFKDSL